MNVCRSLPQTRTGRSLADSMILLNIVSVLRRVDPEYTDESNERSAESVREITEYYFHPELSATLESDVPDYTVGHVVNPGHDIECSWFLMREANTFHNKELHGAAKINFQ